jgi:general secretion pathway protein H
MKDTRTDHHQAGFTLVEILVVLAITAIVFGLSALSLSVLKNRTSPETLAIQTVRLLNHVRDGASARMRPAAATIDMQNRTVSSDFDDPIQFPDTFKLVVTVGRETVSNTERLQVHFLPDGTSSGVDISISDPAGRTTRVQTNWLTGLTRQVDVGK